MRIGGGHDAGSDAALLHRTAQCGDAFGDGGFHGLMLTAG
jgi:hypothetical protein